MLVKEEITGIFTPLRRKYSISVYPKVPAIRKRTVAGLFMAAISGLKAIRKCIDFLTISVFNSLRSLPMPAKDDVKPGEACKTKDLTLFMT
jgi:hypothetical protein